MSKFKLIRAGADGLSGRAPAGRRAPAGVAGRRALCTRRRTRRTLLALRTPRTVRTARIRGKRWVRGLYPEHRSIKVLKIDGP